MSNHTTRWLRSFRGWSKILWLLPIIAIVSLLFSPYLQAADGDGFNIQVSPSPLSVTLTPGQQQTATLTIRNLSTHEETLTPSLNGVQVSETSDTVELTPEVPLGVADWVSFNRQTITVGPGQSQPLEIIYNPPKEVGFSYAVAIKLRAANAPATNQGTAIQAEVAVFNLININRPDAKRELQIESFKSDKSRYEFLPAGFELTVKNTGNVISQPSGTLFIQKSFNDNNPIASIPINKSGGYILPDTMRRFATVWENGFPYYQTIKADDGTAEKTKLRWDFRQLGDLRMGKYVAKVVLVYNDGQRDVPLVASTTFWVIPWRLLAVTLVIGGLMITGLVVWGKAVFKGTKKVDKYASRR